MRRPVPCNGANADLTCLQARASLCCQRVRHITQGHQHARQAVAPDSVSSSNETLARNAQRGDALPQAAQATALEGWLQVSPPAELSSHQHTPRMLTARFTSSLSVS